MPINKSCLYCFSLFSIKPSHVKWRKYCSKICMCKAKEVKRLKKCIVCKREFKFYWTKRSTGQFCSHYCKGQHFRNAPIIKICEFCKKEFNAPLNYKIKKYCSNECYAQTMIGKEKTSFWETASKEEQLARLQKSFDKFVIKNENGCWGWKGSPSKLYGSLQYGGKYKSITAHRASWLLHYNENPGDKFVCHHCDNPRCTRPDHLFLGTSKDNVHDMIKKGRDNYAYGERAYGSKLTKESVINIRQLIREKTVTEIARLFNISQSVVSEIKNKKAWKHILMEEI